MRADTEIRLDIEVDDKRDFMKVRIRSASWADADIVDEERDHHAPLFRTVDFTTGEVRLEWGRWLYELLGNWHLEDLGQSCLEHLQARLEAASAAEPMRLLIGLRGKHAINIPVETMYLRPAEFVVLSPHASLVRRVSDQARPVGADRMSAHPGFPRRAGRCEIGLLLAGEGKADLSFDALAGYVAPEPRHPVVAQTNHTRRVEDGDWETPLRYLLSEDPDILVLAGHAEETTFIVGPSGPTWTEVTSVIREHPPSVVVMLACDGAGRSSGGHEPAALSIARCGVPVAIGFQGTVHSDQGQVFATTFLEQLALRLGPEDLRWHGPIPMDAIERALRDARQAANGNEHHATLAVAYVQDRMPSTERPGSTASGLASRR